MDNGGNLAKNDPGWPHVSAVSCLALADSLSLAVSRLTDSLSHESHASLTRSVCSATLMFIALLHAPSVATIEGEVHLSIEEVLEAAALVAREPDAHREPLAWIHAMAHLQGS